MGYIILLAVLLAVYAAAVLLMKCFAHSNAAVFILIGFVVIPYLWLMRIVYNDVGFNDWNFQNTLPVANVSPFMFTLTPLTLLLRGRARECLQRLISLLSVGMICSSILSCVYWASIGYKFHFHFALDFISHVALSLLGVLFAVSGRVDIAVKKCLASAAVIFSAATVMVVLNLIFDTSFFGLSLRGKHNIYNNVLVESSYLSAALYYVGLFAVLALGYAFVKLLTRKIQSR